MIVTRIMLMIVMAIVWLRGTVIVMSLVTIKAVRTAMRILATGLVWVVRTGRADDSDDL